MTATTSRTQNLLDLMENDTNQRIISALAREGDQRFSPLAATTGLSHRKLSSHLKPLRQAMIVHAKSLPSAGERIWLQYGLTPRGRAMYDAILKIHGVLDADPLLWPARDALQERLDRPVETAV